MKKFQNIGKGNGVAIAFGAILIGLWELIAILDWIPPFILPSPISVFHTLLETFPIMFEHIKITVLEAGIGFLIAVFLSAGLGILVDWVPLLKKAIYPIIMISQTIPIVTLAPLFAMWFGYGYLPKILVVILVCFFPIAVSFIEGLASVDKELLNLLRSMGANPFQIYRMVKIPAALPHLFSGLKIAGTYSIMGAVIGEWIGGKEGLGVYMLRVRHSFSIDKVFATIVIITLCSIFVVKFIHIIEKKLMPWTKELPNQNEGEIS